MRASDFIEGGRRYGFDFYAGVPCSFIQPLINQVINDDRLRYVACANEGDAVAVASGAWLGGRNAVAMMQNSGLGNAVNPLTSLNFIFDIPILVIVTWRGEPGFADEPQHELMGQITCDLLDKMGIAWEFFSSRQEEVAGVWKRVTEHFQTRKRPYALVMKKDSLEPARLERGLGSPRTLPVSAHEPSTPASERVTRGAALARILKETAGPDDLVVTTTGYTSRELFAMEDRPNHFYMVGSMGCAVSVGLGLALARPDKRVVVIDGDGALLMRLGALATAGFYAPPNLTHILLDNEAHESTGGQDTVASRVDWRGLAGACGYRRLWDGSDPGILSKGLGVAAGQGPVWICLKIRQGIPDKLPRPTVAPRQVQQRFRSRVCGGVEPR